MPRRRFRRKQVKAKKAEKKLDVKQDIEIGKLKKTVGQLVQSTKGLFINGNIDVLPLTFATNTTGTPLDTGSSLFPLCCPVVDDGSSNGGGRVGNWVRMLRCHIGYTIALDPTIVPGEQGLNQNVRVIVFCMYKPTGSYNISGASLIPVFGDVFQYSQIDANVTMDKAGILAGYNIKNRPNMTVYSDKTYCLNTSISSGLGALTHHEMIIPNKKNSIVKFNNGESTLVNPEDIQENQWFISFTSDANNDAPNPKFNVFTTCEYEQ